VADAVVCGAAVSAAIAGLAVTAAASAAAVAIRVSAFMAVSFERVATSRNRQNELYASQNTISI
jgi:hypothetical protein